MTLEVCCGNLESVHAAVNGGAQRIELCSALEVEGLTPSWDVLQQARKLYPSLIIHVLIRSRAGNFCYSPEEVSQMAAQIEKALELGADGIVVGALTARGEVDVPTMQTWTGIVDDWLLAKGFEAAGCHSCMDAYYFQGMVKRPSVTFHRAFDACKDPFRALEDIIGLGCSRVLTSGQAATALEGTPLLKELRLRADGRIGILPGGGITPDNARAILDATGCTELHASASVLQPDGRKITSAALVAAILAVRP